MAKPKVYLETSVISYLTSRASRDVIILGHQQVTREWWERRRGDFDLVVSELVIREAAAGDEDAARERLKVLEGLHVLKASERALALAEELVNRGPIPETSGEDALHIAIAVTNGAEYLLTWNHKHLANAAMRTSIEKICRTNGFEPSVLCTLEELLEK